MIFYLGLVSIIFGYLLGLIILRKNSWKGGLFHSSTDFASPMFLLFVPSIILIINLLLVIIGLSFGYNFNFFKDFLLVNLIPISLIIVYFVLRQRLIKIKQEQELIEAKNRHSIEKWLSSLKDHADSLQIDFYTYTVDGHIAGKIIAKYKNTDTKNLLLESRKMLPKTVSLEIGPSDSQILH